MFISKPQLFCVIIVICFTPKIIICNDAKLDTLHQMRFTPCKACKTFVESFKKAMEKVDVKDKLESVSSTDDLNEYKKIKNWICSDVKGQDQCNSFHEQYNNVLEEWWLNYQDRDFFQYFCIDTIEHCCPNLHYGPDCLPCTGYPNRVCSNNGKCKGAGTREGNGQCSCDPGYTGEICDQCADMYYESYKDDSKLLCSKCHASCGGNCTNGGPMGCERCARGWVMSKEKGCSDINECVGLKPVCNPLQFCVNTDGAYKCLECDPSCAGCTGDGPDMCINCANGYTLIDNMCVDDEQERRKQHVLVTRYLTYFGLCVATCIVFQKNVILAAVIGLAVGIYISISEYILNSPPVPNTMEFMKKLSL